jgi:integrase
MRLSCSRQDDGDRVAGDVPVLVSNRPAIDRSECSGPTIRDWRLATIPKAILPQEVERVVQACDLRTATGRRDRAVLLLLARLGLRAGEVVVMELDDIDWRAGELTIRGKKGLRHGTDSDQPLDGNGERPTDRKDLLH